ncbi:MAG: hypothetical protein A3I65_01185 [Betaproteobacteria bacterium RIFCSPLOWO2_02_FULL_68_150]|nr:MAG: hypothetical protein A3I65_01185 [Betaproteobacteria bacterium RIFCSPLOWO2_02_FULL_68_150]
MTRRAATFAVRAQRRTRAAVAVSLGALVASAQAQAHGFGARYDLPIPLSLYLAGAGLTVALSFAMLALFMRKAPSAGEYRSIDLTHTVFGRLLGAPGVLLTCRMLGVALFLLVVTAGLFGVQSPLKNIAPVMVWAIWWVGMAYISALLGNLWALVNPLDTLFAWTEALCARIWPGRELTLGLRYPDTLGAWPASVLFLAFVWMEVVWEHSDSPAYLATAMLGYSALTWLGMLLFGRAQWLRRGEVFALVFGLLARFAPTELRESGAGRCALDLRPYGVGLLSREPVSNSILVLVLAMLAAVSFDGFIETPLWAAILEYYAPPAQDLASDSGAARAWVQTAGVIGAPLLFVAVYLVFARLIAWGGEARVPVTRTAGLFVLTLVPIAIAYHLAHYLSFLAMAGQYLIPLASDPFGFGRDLFGTKNYFVRIGLVDARAVWYISIGAIVTGHVVAVYLAHRTALRAYSDRRLALRSQWPMVALMVCYTMISLWIIAQPIVTIR